MDTTKEELLTMQSEEHWTRLTRPMASYLEAVASYLNGDGLLLGSDGKTHLSVVAVGGLA